MGRRLVMVTAIALLLSDPARAATPATDDAGDSAYDGGWATGDDGGSGWGGPWNGLSPAPDFAVGSSTSNGDGDSNRDGDIDTGGRAWAASASQLSVPFNASRPFDGALTVGQTVTVEFDHDALSAQAGLRLVSSLGEQRFSLLWFASNQDYFAIGEDFAAMNVPYTDEGLVIEFTLTGPATFSVDLRPIGGPTSTATGPLADGVDVARLILNGSSSGAPETFYFNSITLPEPSTAASTTALIAALALCTRRKRMRVERHQHRLRATAAALAMFFLCTTLFLSTTLLLSTTAGADLVMSDIVNDSLYDVDPGTGAGSSIGPIGINDVNGLAYDPNSDVLYGSSTVTDELIEIDPDTGVGTSIGSRGFGVVLGLAFDRNTNTLYGSDSGTDGLITVDQSTGMGTSVGSAFGDGFTSMHGLAFDPNSDTLYGADTTSGVLTTIDTATGVATEIGLIGSVATGLAFDDATDTLYGVDSSNHLISINTTTGAGSTIGSLGSPLARGLTFLPEPSSQAVVSIAFLLAIGAGARSRRNRSETRQRIAASG